MATNQVLEIKLSSVAEHVFATTLIHVKPTFKDFTRSDATVSQHCLSQDLQGVFFNWYPPKKLKYGKPRLGESTLTA